MRKDKYDVYGTFKVTTEGDCEGRSIRNLGIYTGYIDEIAFALADECYYALTFEKVESEDLDMSPKRSEVNIKLGRGSCTWDMSSEDRLHYYQKLFAGRNNISVSESNFYASVLLKNTNYREDVKRRALEKLTAEEREALGF